MRRVESFTIIAFNYIQNSAGIPFPPVKVFGIQNLFFKKVLVAEGIYSLPLAVAFDTNVKSETAEGGKEAALKV